MTLIIVYITCGAALLAWVMSRTPSEGVTIGPVLWILFLWPLLLAGMVWDS